MKKMKFLLLLLLPLLLCSCSKNYIINSTIDDIEKKVENNESFILYIGSSDCSNCASFTPKLKNVVNKNKITVYYIDIYNISDEDYTRLFKIVNFQGTPTVAFIKNGMDPGSQTHIRGNVSMDEIISSFKNNDYIK